VGIASAFVSFNVALYYNTIISWCLLYFVRVSPPLSVGENVNLVTRLRKVVDCVGPRHYMPRLGPIHLGFPPTPPILFKVYFVLHFPQIDKDNHHSLLSLSSVMLDGLIFHSFRFSLPKAPPNNRLPAPPLAFTSCPIGNWDWLCLCALMTFSRVSSLRSRGRTARRTLKNTTNAMWAHFTPHTHHCPQLVNFNCIFILLGLGLVDEQSNAILLVSRDA